MRDELPDIKVLAVLMVLLIALLAFITVGVMNTKAEARTAVQPVMNVGDVKILQPEAVPAAVKASAQVLVDARENEPEAEQADEYYEPEYVEASYDGYYGGSYEIPYSDMYNEDGPTRNMPGWHDGYVETYYDASAHYMSGEWTVDSEGFYHDENGRYVIGVDINSGLEYGDVVDTGRGEAVVYDYGAGVSNVHDFAVAGAPNR